jgi:glucosamine-6-phosphate deaminase
MKVIKVKSYEELSALAAKMIAEQVKSKPDSVIGLATGSTPIGTYKKLIEANLDFSKIKTFNLDEYCGLSKEHDQSYYYFMMDNLFKHINIKHENLNFPSEANCNEYDDMIEKSGGIDLQLLGVGSNGHIGFNEPDEVFHNLTRVVALAESTIKDNARFFDNINDVPKTAISMGIGTIMAARKIVLVADSNKAGIMKQLEEPVVSPQIPASILKYHPDCTIIFVLPS